MRKLTIPEIVEAINAGKRARGASLSAIDNTATFIDGKVKRLDGIHTEQIDAARNLRTFLDTNPTKANQEYERVRSLIKERNSIINADKIKWLSEIKKELAPIMMCAEAAIALEPVMAVLAIHWEKLPLEIAEAISERFGGSSVPRVKNQRTTITAGTERKLISKRDAAREAGVCTRTIGQWLQKGMPHIKCSSRLIRIDLDEMICWIKEQYSVRRRRNRGMKVTT